MTLLEAAEALAAECEKRFWCPAECRALRAAIAEERALAAEMSQWEKAADEDQEKAVVEPAPASEEELGGGSHVCKSDGLLKPYPHILCSRCEPTPAAPASEEPWGFVVEWRECGTGETYYRSIDEARAEGYKACKNYQGPFPPIVIPVYRHPPAADEKEVRLLRELEAVAVEVNEADGKALEEIAVLGEVIRKEVDTTLVIKLQNAIVALAAYRHRAGKAKGE